MRPSVLVVAVLLWGPSLAASAKLNARIRSKCGNEIGLLCGGRRDVAACLDEQYNALTPPCRYAVLEKDAPPTQMPAWAPAAVARPAPPTVDATSARMPFQRALIEIQSNYEGKGSRGFKSLRALLEKSMPGTLSLVANGLGLPQYSAGMTQPLRIGFYYDPTSQEGLAHVGPSEEGSAAQRMEFNLARWEDCPSEEQMRSILAHELTHAVLQDYLYGRDYYNLPRWINEGLATLVGGEPMLTAKLDADYVQLVRKRKLGEGICSLDNDLENGRTLPDCYARYYLAVHEITNSSPDEIGKLLANLRRDIPAEESIRLQTGANWSEFQGRVRARAKRTFDGMGTWHMARHKLRMWFWCAGSAS